MPKILAPDYWSRFRCLEGACVDTCCRGTPTKISQDDYRRLKLAVGPSVAAQGTQRNGDHMLRRDRSGHCYFLRQDRLCSLQASHGEAALPKPCAAYPRRAAVGGGRLDVAGTLACPEVARLCLTEDWEIEAASVDLGLLYEDRAEMDPTSPYLAQYELVQEALLRILSQEGKSVEGRLEALAGVAERVSGYFHQETAEADAPRLAAQLSRDFAEAFKPRTRRTTGLDDVMALRVGQYFLDEHRVDRASRLGRLVERIRKKYERAVGGPELTSLEDGEALTACDRRALRTTETSAGRRDGRGMLGLYRARRASMRLGHSRRIERYFTNYCRNYVLVEPYFRWPNLQHYAGDLALCLASLRFLLFSHPGVCVPWGTVGAEPRDVEGDAWSTAALDSAAVETFQALTRSVEQTTLLEELRGAWFSEGLGQTLP
jgi:lysine-N-methylase